MSAAVFRLMAGVASDDDPGGTMTKAVKIGGM